MENVGPPNDLRQITTTRRFGVSWLYPDRCRGSYPQPVNQNMTGDRVKPAADRSGRGVKQPGVTPRPHHRLLHDLLGVMVARSQLLNVGLQRGAVLGIKITNEAVGPRTVVRDPG